MCTWFSRLPGYLKDNKPERSVHYSGIKYRATACGDFSQVTDSQELLDHVPTWHQGNLQNHQMCDRLHKKRFNLNTG